MENIKDNSKETVELKGKELEKVAGGGNRVPKGYRCSPPEGCGKVFTGYEDAKPTSCPYCGCTNISPCGFF